MSEGDGAEVDPLDELGKGVEGVDRGVGPEGAFVVEEE